MVFMLSATGLFYFIGQVSCTLVQMLFQSTKSLPLAFLSIADDGINGLFTSQRRRVTNKLVRETRLWLWLDWLRLDDTWLESLYRNHPIPNLLCICSNHLPSLNCD
ncbi:hypothetical protein HS088_TW14G00973 [Tripterygium wilfordii]|uniref:Uncharacterized protein n=1 Tax=Tripterygium wilfordii TaxID=458696 RepID=A0A7J7CS42_TRIWF|nr:hypothetical protein HS088_TW14G00973 [Tripterygium wilfordii]